MYKHCKSVFGGECSYIACIKDMPADLENSDSDQDTENFAHSLNHKQLNQDHGQ